MTTELSPELRQALAASPDGPVELVDSTTKRTYVLVSAELFRRVQSLLGDERDVVQSMSPFLADLAPEDWEDAANYA
jgi:hypothetical protein